MSSPPLPKSSDTNSSAATDPAAHHADEDHTAAKDIVERALAILDQESRDWVKGHRRKNSMSERADPHSGGMP
jgi:hypothetical protein